jgi:hypothetical protein
LNHFTIPLAKIPSPFIDIDGCYILPPDATAIFYTHAVSPVKEKIP